MKSPNILAFGMVVIAGAIVHAAGVLGNAINGQSGAAGAILFGALLIFIGGILIVAERKESR